MYYGIPFRALEEWGSWQSLEQELMKRKQEADEAEKRRKGALFFKFTQIIAFLFDARS